MICKVYSADIFGIEACKVCVEADVSGGLPAFHMVGMLSSEVREAKDRVIRALCNSGVDLPPRKITINLSPANVRKQGTGFDLPIAVAILTALGIISETAVENRMFVGELSLDGAIRKVNGVLPIALLAGKEGISDLFVPSENTFEGAVAEGVNVCGACDLKTLVYQLNHGLTERAATVNLEEMLQNSYEQSELDYRDVKGQEKAKRATQIAVAGFHHLLYIGSPGSGKSMMARRIPTIFSRLSVQESLEISGIYSVMGLLEDHQLIVNRPFRAPHHSVTGPSLVGGCGNPRPGEITLAHRGVLFLDEAAEFHKEVIELLRQPLETRSMTITRLLGQAVFPADFMLVMAMNPCKCGYYPDRTRCKCTEPEVNRYFGKIKGPILDRIDICVGTANLNCGDFFDDSGMDSAFMREGVQRAQEVQKKRFQGTDIRFNSRMGKKEIDRYCTLSREAQQILEKSYDRCRLTARGYYKILKVARTIADTDGEDIIAKQHIVEAIGYRNTYM